MKSNKLSFSVFAAFALMGLGYVQAQPGSDSSPKAKATMVPSVHLSRKEILEKLQLTSEQNQALRKNRAAYRKKIAELDGQLKIKKVELENEMEKPEPDQTRLQQIADQIGDIQGQKVSEKIKAELEVEKKILTPQQVELLKTLQGKETSTSGEILGL